MTAVWTGIHPYLAGLDCFIPTQGKSARYKIHAKNLEMQVEAHLQRIGNSERTSLVGKPLSHEEE